MVLVDDAANAFPSMDHAPWFGVTVSDFVMPFFLFVVGVSVSLVFKVCRVKNGFLFLKSVNFVKWILVD